MVSFYIRPQPRLRRSASLLSFLILPTLTTRIGLTKPSRLEAAAQRHIISRTLHNENRRVQIEAFVEPSVTISKIILKAGTF